MTHNPKPVTDAQMKLARECAVETLEKARSGSIVESWTIQSALLAIQATEARMAAVVVPEDVRAWAESTLACKPFHGPMPMTDACRFILSLIDQ